MRGRLSSFPSKNFFSALSSQWLSTGYVAGISLLVTFVLGRVMGPSLFGTYSYLLTLGSLFLILQDGGFKTLIFREKTSPSPRFRSYSSQLLSLALGHAFLLSLLGIGGAFLLSGSLKWGLSLALLCFGLQALYYFTSSELKARDRFPRDALWQIQARTLSVAGMLLGLYLGAHQPYAIFLGWSLGLGLCLILFSPIPLPKPKMAGIMNKGIFKPCLAFMTIDAATVIYYKCDIVLLQNLTRNSSEVGQYVASYRFLDGIILLAAPLGAIWFRKLRLIWDEKKAFYLQLLEMSLALLASAFVILGIGTIFKQEILLYTFGEKYSQASLLLPWLLCSLVFVLPNTILTQAAIAQNRERLYAFAAGFGAFFNIGINLLLIPTYGAFGAALATIATEGVLSLFLIWGVLRWS